MRYAIVLLGMLAVVGCQKDKSGETGSATTTGASAGRNDTTTVVAVREQMRRDQPGSSTIIQDLVITEDGNTITLSGIVPDETTHDQLVKSAEHGAGGKKVQDNLRVMNK